MCKPVIYFYPEKDELLSVKVQPNGGFTFSKPTYDNGWNVKAFKDGKILDLNSKKEYDYLFWEGMGLNYPIKDEGWVVKKENLNLFLGDKLKVLGLNEKEIKDFKKYWIERLNEKPYYKLSFLTRDEFDRIAPLSISPVNPRNVIRVMMTAEGLDNFITIPKQELPETPERSGFTVVEWGGAVLR